MVNSTIPKGLSWIVCPASSMSVTLVIIELRNSAVRDSSYSPGARLEVKMASSIYLWVLGSIRAGTFMSRTLSTIECKSFSETGPSCPPLSLVAWCFDGYAVTPGLSQLVRFSWFPNVTIRTNYNVTVQAQQVLGDPNVANNILAGGLFNVRMKGDVNGDCRVDIVDLSTIGAKFGLVRNDGSYVSAPNLTNTGTSTIINLFLTAENFERSC